jgi:hypothetical protein
LLLSSRRIDAAFDFLFVRVWNLGFSCMDGSALFASWLDTACGLAVSDFAAEDEMVLIDTLSNKLDAVNPAMALWFSIEDQWRRVSDPGRSPEA